MIVAKPDHGAVEFTPREKDPYRQSSESEPVSAPLVSESIEKEQRGKAEDERRPGDDSPDDFG